MHNGVRTSFGCVTGVTVRIATAFAVALVTACSGAPATGSIGAVLGRDEESHAVFVRDVPETSQQPDLLPGDELVMVDGTFVRDLSTKELRKRLRGEPGTKVKVTLLRGASVVRVELTRTPLKEVLKKREEPVDEE
ncbi:MAG TPA: PDZ domain-containing protein [Polyangiaceae bacterium]|nr:PDZ domain-containing protein [Polyangiaceae bacterium]